MVKRNRQRVDPDARQQAEALAELVRARRNGRPFREAAREAGLTASTIYRLELGAHPDFDTLVAALRWVGRPLNLHEV
jgi:DNA-binding phage protein